LVLRKLTASGYSIGQKLRARGVEVICLKDPLGISMLLVSNVFYGPSWAQIHKALASLDSKLILLTLGTTPAVLIEDSACARERIEGLFNFTNSAVGRQVHLEGVGFVELETKVKPELKRFALPLVSIVCVVGLGIIWGSSAKPSQRLDLPPVSMMCIVDSTSSEFQGWIIDSLSGEGILSLGEEVQKSTASGAINIVVESTIGSAAKVRGSAVCDDGRKRTINHRVDTSGSGAILELGQ
jgi:hypothetical protein